MVRRGWQGFAGSLAAALWVMSCVTSCSGGGTTEAPGADAASRPEGGPPLDGRAHVPDGSTADAVADRAATGTGCDAGAQCQSGVCTVGVCEAPTPTDGVKNDSETDVDCGGGSSPTSDGAPACANGKSCLVRSDCTSTSCQGGKCVPPSCTDGIKDGAETDIDCGGPTCAGCPTGDACLVPTDCANDVCAGGVCDAPTATDGVKNDSETDVDCGGSSSPMTDGAPVCAVGKKCLVGSDCAQGVCGLSSAGAGGDGGADAMTSDGGASVLTCQPASPTDHVKNDSETDVDCGGALLAGGGASSSSDGAPACGSGKACAIALDCVSLVCTADVCQAPSATDHVKNDSETDVDCGGGFLAGGASNPDSDGAPACPYADSCVLGTDCANLVCETGVVTTPSATGKPIDCPAGQTCTCQKPTPTDGVDNDSETDIDCGGDYLVTGAANSASDEAPVCAVGKHCLLGTDCAESVCNATAGAGAGPPNCPAGGDCVCQAASPNDGVENDSETDIDCGGALLASGASNPASDHAAVCAVGKKCLLGSDCAQGVCNASAGSGVGPVNCLAGDACTCQPASPHDGVRNDSETDVDCGGALLASGVANVASDAAPGCADAFDCMLDSDCLSAYCSTLSHTCVAGQSCVGLAPSASIMDIKVAGNGTTDATGTPDSNGSGQHAGLDTCGKGESTDPASAQNHESCCRSLVIPAAVLPAGDAANTRLDKYEVTAGRMRQFIETVSAEEAAVNGGTTYDIRDWMLAQFSATPMTDVATRFAAQIPTGTTPQSIIELFPSAWYGNFNIVATLGGTTMDPFHPSSSQGCYVADGANGATTYWWTAVSNQTVSPVIVGMDVVGAAGRPYTQDYYDIKSMNCAPFWMYAAFCAWDGGHVASLAELDAVYGKQQYPWDTTGESTFLPADYTYTTVTTTGANPKTYHYENFVPGAPFYVGTVAAGAPGYNAVDLTVNWNNDSFNSNSGDFYYYPNGGGGPTDPPLSVSPTSGLDYSPFIAAPGRFYLDRTAILSPSGSGTEGWQDLGANMLEMTDTAESTTGVFCDCSGADQATASSLCPTACPNTNPKMYPIPQNGGTPLPSVSWEGGSWEGHTAADPAAATYFSKGGYTEVLQTQYGKAGFRCARAPE